jgi:cardiolipin synthase
MKRFWVKGNALDLYEGGRDYFAALVNCIDRAKREIILVSYIFKHDSIGKLIGAALVKAAKRGVSVSVIVDGVGSLDLPASFIEELRTAGICFRVFRPLINFFRLRKIFLRRLHQKVAIFDEEFAFVGGINIDADQLKQLDYAVAVNGPLALRVHKIAKMFVCRLNHDWFNYFTIRRKRLRAVGQTRGNIRAAFFIRDNIQHRRQIENVYLEAIRSAKKTITIANAYFLPGYRFRQSLREAVKRGVKVRLLLQGRTDHPIVRYATAMLYDELIQGGITIFEYNAEMLHAKVAVVDGYWLTIGSANLDFFSLFLSLEANVVAEDRGLAKELEDRLSRAVERGAKLIDRKSVRARGPLDWTISWLSLFILRFIRFLSGS